MKIKTWALEQKVLIRAVGLIVFLLGLVLLINIAVKWFTVSFDPLLLQLFFGLVFCYGGGSLFFLREEGRRIVVFSMVISLLDLVVLTVIALINRTYSGAVGIFDITYNLDNPYSLVLIVLGISVLPLLVLFFLVDLSLDDSKTGGKE